MNLLQHIFPSRSFQRREQFFESELPRLPYEFVSSDGKNRFYLTNQSVYEHISVLSVQFHIKTLHNDWKSIFWANEASIRGSITTVIGMNAYSRLGGMTYYYGTNGIQEVEGPWDATDIDQGSVYLLTDCVDQINFRSTLDGFFEQIKSLNFYKPVLVPGD